MAVSLTMIVCNEEVNLPRCLGSARGIFDEIVVVDTGSVDRTRDIARDFGARVFDFVWCDDFAAARNAALDRAGGDFAFWLDADDVIDPPARDGLRKLFRRLRGAGVAAYRMPCRIPTAEDPQRTVPHTRLFPIRPGVRWEYRVHEQVQPAIDRAGIPTREVPITVRHRGYLDPARRERSLERNYRLLSIELAQRPNDGYVAYMTRRALGPWFRQAKEDIRAGLAAGCSVREAAIRAAERLERPETAALFRALPSASWEAFQSP